MMFSPLEIFEIVLYLPINFFGLDISFTNSFFFLFFLFFFLSFFSFFSFYKPTLIPNSYQSVFESLYGFVLEMVREQVGKRALPFFPIFLSVFFFILSSNLIGLLPFSFTITAQFSIAFAFAFAFNISFIIFGFLFNGLSFFRLFVPSGAPLFLLPLITIIEIVSYLIRTFSLSIRLFANMMAGHTLLHILATFALTFLKSPSFGLFLAVFSFFVPFTLILAVYALELGIAFIQSYVFVVLLIIYLNDSFEVSH